MKLSLFVMGAALVLVGCSHQSSPSTPQLPEPPITFPVVELPVLPIETPEPPVVTPVKPPAKPTPPPTPKPKPCVKGGCSSQLCIEEGTDGFSTCEFKPEYGCTQQATCERQQSGSCGWTPTQASKACYEELQKQEEAAKVPPPAPTPVTVQATVQGFAFKGPDGSSVIKIKKGDTVTWTQNDPTVHTVTSDSGSELGSDALSQGGKYSHTFTKAGTFAYHCNPHPGMTGTVIVE